VTDDECGALLRNTYQFLWRTAAISGKSGYAILHRETTLLKNRSYGTGDFKNLKRVGVP
jgi:hypothetical protein